MEIQNLLDRIQSTKEKQPHRFLAIEIGNEIVRTAVWEVISQKTQIVAIGPSEELASDNLEDLLLSVDASLSKVLETVEPEPNEVIFGLPESWVSDSSIIDAKKTALKTLCQKLKLKALGFVVTSESLVHYLKQKEGSPPTAILLLLSETDVSVTLVKVGKIIASQLVGRSEDLGADVEEGLARFGTNEPFPSRMLLSNSHLDLESAKQVLLSYAWQEKLPFLHFPKIEVLPSDVTIEAIALAGGAEVAKSLGFDIVPEEPEKEAAVRQSAASPAPLPQKPAPTPSEDLGFVKDADIFKTTPPPRPAFPKSASPSHLDESATFTFPSSKQRLQEEEIIPVSPPKPRFKRFLSHFFPPRLPRFLLPLPRFTRKNTLVVLFVTALLTFLALFTLGLAVIWYLPQAQVVLTVTGKSLDKEVIITLDPESESFDPEKLTLPAQPVSQEVAGSKQIDTTGEKIVGEKATGSVALYNKTNSAKTFAAGTLLTGPQNLAFTLDQEVAVASQSSGLEGTTYGKAEAPITAQAIGSQYNLATNQDFIVSDFSSTSFSAHNQTEFTGGSSRTIQAVAEADQQKVKADLHQELVDQAIQQLADQSASSLDFLKATAQTQILEEEYSDAVGAEADQLSLKLKLTLTTLTYQQNDFTLLLQQTIKTSVPEGYQLPAVNQIESEIKSTQVSQTGQAKLTVLLKTKLIPQLNLEEIKKNLRNKYPELTQDYLKTIPGFVKVDIKITPNLPAKLKTLPRNTNRINLEVKTE